MQTDLSYVKEQLARVGRAGWAEAAKKTGIHPRTVSRIAYDETRAPRSDVVGKLAIHFRTQEKRRK
jgi:hypothetical protein